MEYWDLYNKDRQKLNKTVIRGEKIDDGEYFLAVNIWIMNNKNELLVTQRHPERTWPLKWECTGGAVLAGEDSYSGALREVEEEIGIKLKTKGKLINTIILKDYIKDVYIFKEDIKIEDTKLEEGAVVNIKWVTFDELDEMIKNNEIAGQIIGSMEKLKEYGNI
jgi:8-oxo-dGTP pyrophosphatase MutT (NUDIX family)